ncbi:MAG: diacylglycerol kinase family protein [Bacteroidota bacterium]
MRTLFLINPGSGRKRNADKTDQLIRDIYQKADRSVETRMLDFSQLDAALEMAIEEGFENIFAVGGDGTVNAIGARLIDKPVNLGVIPNGSGNGFARNLGFSIKTRLAVTQSLDARAIKVDTGRFNDIPFLNVAGVGLDADVAFRFSQGSHRGLGPYVRSTTEGLFGFEPEAFQLEIDGEMHQYDALMGVAIANGTQWGYDVKITQDASIADGLLDVIVVKKFPLIKAGLMVRRMVRGDLPDSRYVEVFRAKKVVIHREKAGTAQVDGEPFECDRRIEVVVQEKSLNLLLPNTLTPAKIQSL